MNNFNYKDLDVETTSEARSALRGRYKKFLALEALEKLRFPSYRIVSDATTDEHLGKMHFKQWEKVENDIDKALLENTETYDELEERYFHE